MINESLDSPREWKWETITAHKGQADFESSKGTEYLVIIVRQGSSYFFGFDTKGSVNGDFTNERCAPQILSTVIESFPNTDSMFFYSRANEPSRVRAYIALLARYAKSHDFEFSFDVDDSFVKFTITR